MFQFQEHSYVNVVFVPHLLLKKAVNKSKYRLVYYTIGMAYIITISHMCIYTDGNKCIWDVRVGKLIKTVSGHEDMINDMCVNFVSGGGTGGSSVAVIVTGSDDKMVKMFEYQA